jgi:hypothetical protein
MFGKIIAAFVDARLDEGCEVQMNSALLHQFLSTLIGYHEWKSHKIVDV